MSLIKNKNFSAREECWRTSLTGYKTSLKKRTVHVLRLISPWEQEQDKNFCSYRFDSLLYHGVQQPDEEKKKPSSMKIVKQYFLCRQFDCLSDRPIISTKNKIEYQDMNVQK